MTLGTMLDNVTGTAHGAFVGATRQIRPLLLLTVFSRVAVIGTTTVVARAVDAGLRDLLNRAIIVH